MIIKKYELTLQFVKNKKQGVIHPKLKPETLNYLFVAMGVDPWSLRSRSHEADHQAKLALSRCHRSLCLGCIVTGPQDPKINIVDKNVAQATVSHVPLKGNLPLVK